MKTKQTYILDFEKLSPNFQPAHVTSEIKILKKQSSL